MEAGKIYRSRGFEGPWHGVDAGPSRSPGRQPEAWPRARSRGWCGDQPEE